MSSIPNGALGFGGQISNHPPIAYGKSRVAGSQTFSYILHPKAGSMPGQPHLFITSYFDIPKLDAPIEENQITQSYKHKDQRKLKMNIGPKFAKTYIDNFTFEKYHPHDDVTLQIAISASYRQIYGNLHPMESERPIESERRLRNGDINIKEFIRQLAKSSFYKANYFEAVNQQRSIELSFKHILGRPPKDQAEVIRHVELLFNQGFEYHIDKIIDSHEYEEIFGSYIVPYQRCWNSPCGLKTADFCNIAKLERSFASSDNALHGLLAAPQITGGKSLLMVNLATNSVQDIQIPFNLTKIKKLDSKNPEYLPEAKTLP